MALQDLLDLSDKQKKIGLSEERVRAAIPVGRQYISFWREYPDMFVDYLLEMGNPQEFHFFFYQRVFLRIAMRHQYVYAVFPRAYSKSFLSIMVLMIRCTLYPRCKLFVTSGGKEQAAGIMKEKVQEICNLIPAFKREIDWTRGKTLEGKDYAKYVFKSGSYFDNIAARESSRGKRRHAGVIEECVGVDGQILSEVIIPTMNISRMCMDGSTHPEEQLNKAQLYITTAGYKNTYPYDKLIQLLVWQIVKPEKAMIMGGTYRVPVLMKLLDKNFVKDLKMDGTFNESSFAREYESVWSGTVEDAFFNSEVFDRNRVLKQPEYEASGRASKSSFYILSMDVGRKHDASVVCVFKVTPQPQGTALKQLVNIYTFDDEHFEDQAIKVKKLYYKYNAKRLVVDGNGPGVGFIDYLVKPQVDTETNEIFPDFGVYGGTKVDIEQEYKKYRTANCEEDALYIIMASAPMNNEAHSNVQTQLSSGKVKMLIDERVAKTKLLGTVKGQNMKPEERAEYLKPFTLTSILKEEMMNLKEENEGVNIILKRANKGIRKDKFSAFEYGLYYIKQEEDNKKKKKRFNAKEWKFFSST
nr:MAG TPA: terminase large subunit [Caudoviricetes sp.]